MKTKLSANVINSCICPAEKRFVYIQDTLVPGLFVCVTRAGEKNFVLRFTPPGGKQRICKSFASCESITLTAARNQAKSLKAQFTVGKDPFQEAKAEKEEYQKNGLKLSELFSLWKNDSEKRKEDRQSLKNCFSSLGGLKKKRIRDIDSAAVRAWQTEKIESGMKNSSINRVVTEFRFLLNWGKQNKHVSKDWKIPEIKRLSEIGCEPKRGGLSDEEIKKFLAATDDWQKQEEKYYMKPIVLFLLNTGLRPASVCGLIWSDVDFQSRTLYIRAANIKTRKSMHIALSNVALEILRTLPRGKDDENIFTTFQSQHICKKIKEIFVLAGMPDKSAYWIRHNYACALVRAGRSAPEIQAQMTHTDFRTTQKYIHVDLKHQREVANAVTFAA